MPGYSTPTRFFAGEIPTSQTEVYTVPTTSKAILSSISFTNYVGPATGVKIWVVPATESVADEYMLVSVDGLTGSYREGSIGAVLEPGDSIYIQADDAGVAGFLFGAEVIEI